MSGICIFFTLLMAGIIFTIEPGESLLPKIKCWDCRSDNSKECVTTTISTTCRRGYYCRKSYSKYSNPSDGRDWTEHECVPREYVLYDEDPLNECIEYKEDSFTETRCVCDKNDCNSGLDFVPTFNLTPGLECLNYKPRQNDPIDISFTTTTCYKGYYCYKYLVGVDENGAQDVQRGCIHNKFASSIGVNINQCGEFEINYKKYPFCICDQDKCNSGNFTSQDSVKPIKPTKPVKPFKPTPCPPSSNSGTNTFQQISLILIWVLA